MNPLAPLAMIRDVHRDGIEAKPVHPKDDT